ncbi:hypothetical protein D782_2335 [Enterobacteriaceae bacterium strain FGI 57]|nr:hypothetical protein D782_2335 [Enterobacteriaceae bacterium strain FGI 57]
MRRKRLIRPTKYCKFNILHKTRRPDKRSASGTLCSRMPGANTSGRNIKD